LRSLAFIGGEKMIPMFSVLPYWESSSVGSDPGRYNPLKFLGSLWIPDCFALAAESYCFSLPNRSLPSLPPRDAAVWPGV